MGIVGNYLNIIKAIYNKPITNNILTGEKVKAFPLGSGTEKHIHPWTFFGNSFRSPNHGNWRRKEIKVIQNGEGEVKLSLLQMTWCDTWKILKIPPENSSAQFSSAAQSRPNLYNLMDCSTPGFPVHHQLQELAQTHVHPAGDAIQPSHLLSSPYPPVFNLSQHPDLFQWVSLCIGGQSIWASASVLPLNI